MDLARDLRVLAMSRAHGEDRLHLLMNGVGLRCMNYDKYLAAGYGWM